MVITISDLETNLLTSGGKLMILLCVWVFGTAIGYDRRRPTLTVSEHLLNINN